MKKIALFISMCVWCHTAQANEVLVQSFAFPNTITITSFDDGNTVFKPQPNKKYLVSFWASWCVPCITEIKHFVPLYDALAEHGIELVLVNVDRRPKTAIPKFMNRYHIAPYTHFYVADMYEALQGFESRGIPITVIVDNKNVLARYDFERVQWDADVLDMIIQSFSP